MNRKMAHWLRLVALSATLSFLGAAISPPTNSQNMPFGSKEDVAFAQELWLTMAAEGLVGAGAKPLKPFFGGAKPHGIILELTSRRISVRGHSGDVVVKKNYDGPGVTAAAVSADRNKFLVSINVMYRREAGYDVDNQNWFWVKYRPDGKLFRTDTEGRMIALAGRIRKGKQPGQSRACIFCHRSAGGGDYVFYPRVRLSDRPQERK